ncbi:MAG: sulfate adenylyltransferase [Candidatus Omnitrophica bacterium]|nr:sulfate adenylyltransferase [Candidatus Omnitrophota bacterium]
MSELILTTRQYLDLEKLALGVFAPLTGFMTEREFNSVVQHMRLPDGAVFPLPVVLDVTAEHVARLRGASRLTLRFQGHVVGEIGVDSRYTCDKPSVARQVFGTSDANHPGVAFFYRMGNCFLGGPVRLTRRITFDFSPFDLTPEQTRAYFQRQGWRTIVGFQTRNIPHRAHEYLQRLALTLADGLFIQPLVGWKRRGDYQPLAILTAYRAFIEEFLPADRVLLGVLSTSMRYAGPREAIFHAIIRRNYGCTHFVIGRDHAGVGRYYGKYEAHALVEQLNGTLGIEILRCHGPFYCSRCGEVVTEKSCPHVHRAPDAIREISGSGIRASLAGQGRAAPELIRPEVIASLAGKPLFIEDDEE